MNMLEQIYGVLIIYTLVFVLGAIVITFIMGVWKRDDLSQASKIMWMLFFIFAPVFSIICYLLFAYKRSERR
jgi:hypothetical protein